MPAALRLVGAAILGAATASAACISLATSRLCPAFNGSFISTDTAGKFPFLSFVSNTEEFDTKFATYITDQYVQSKYQDVLGCSGLNLSNTSNLYARFTTSVLCNAMVQEAQSSCGQGTSGAAPLCADSCAQFAISEQVIVSDPATCNSSRSDKNDQVRADFTVCALPADSLSGRCVQGIENESQNCGFSNNLPGLCSYCGSNSPNSTDTCCYNVDLSSCEGIRLPPTASLPPLFTTTVTAVPTETSEPGSSTGLSGGAIAGIAIGSIAAVAALAFLVLCFFRQRKRSKDSIFNQPSPRRRTLEQGQMVYHPSGTSGRHEGYEALPSARIARMSALENNNTSSETGGTPSTRANRSGRGVYESSSPAPYGEKALQPPPRGGRNSSLSSSSMLDNTINSPLSDNRGVSSPMYNGSSQSEQLPAFKDYYSSDNIKPGDDVATLWAYAPRAKDEFELERGDMLRVLGIWDDGWATGVRINGRAEDYIQRRQQRDSGLSTQTDPDQVDPTLGADVKAFPSTIERESEEGFGINEPGPQSSDEINEKSSSSPDRKIGPKGSGRFNDDSNLEQSKR
ncbi:hypothetical protein ABW19_dt0201073 [Dactylella cylindrospora]|nr:hypothetical protein ABW19_dt0201073 [Dactylella cylindrospora]